MMIKQDLKMSRMNPYKQWRRRLALGLSWTEWAKRKSSMTADELHPGGKAMRKEVQRPSKVKEWRSKEKLKPNRRSKAKLLNRDKNLKRTGLKQRKRLKQGKLVDRKRRSGIRSRGPKQLR